MQTMEYRHSFNELTARVKRLEKMLEERLKQLEQKIEEKTLVALDIEPMPERDVYQITVSWVRSKVEQIKMEKDDAEAAHCLEDELHQAVLRGIARGVCDDPVACAAYALDTREIDFPRWYS